MTYETAQYQLLLVFESPWTWVLWVLVLAGLLMPVAGMIVWKAKQEVRTPDLSWTFRESDVTLLEFRDMIRQYATDYQYLMARADYRLMALASVVGLTLVGAPIILMRTTVYVISITPVIAGFLMMILGGLITMILFRLIPGPLSDEFPFHSCRRMRKGLSQIIDLPGTSWAGIRVLLGESHGLFTIRAPRPEVRVEDIESVARIECETDRAGIIVSANAILEKVNGEEERISSITSDVTRLELTRLVKQLLEAYVRERGDEGLLDEILQEVEQAIESLRKTQ